MDTTVHVRQYISKNYAWGLALVLQPLIDPMPPLRHPKKYFLDPPLDLLVQKWQVQEKGSDRDIGENEEKEKGSEGAVQKRTFNYFPRPRLKTFYVMVIQIG